MWLKLFLYTVFMNLNQNCEALDNGLALKPPMGWISFRYTDTITDCNAYPNECLRYFLLFRFSVDENAL